MNQQENHEDNIKTEPLTDLPVAGEQVDEIKAGRTDSGDYNVWRSNFGVTV